MFRVILTETTALSFRHPLKHVDRADYEDSTGNLGRHVRRCDPDDTAQTEMITAYGQGTQYSYARVRFYTAMWCSRRHRPFVIVEDAELLQLLKMLYGRVELPKRLTVSRDIQFIHETTKIRLIGMLKVRRRHSASCSFANLTAQGLPCRIHICVDGWTSPNILAFLGITAHWHNSGKIRHVILDFVRYIFIWVSRIVQSNISVLSLTTSHTGKHLAESLVKALREFGIEEKVRFLRSSRARILTSATGLWSHLRQRGEQHDNAERNAHPRASLPRRACSCPMLWACIEPRRQGMYSVVVPVY